MVSRVARSEAPWSPGARTKDVGGARFTRWAAQGPYHHQPRPRAARPWPRLGLSPPRAGVEGKQKAYHQQTAPRTTCPRRRRRPRCCSPPDGMSPGRRQRTPGPVGVLEGTNCRSRGIPPAKDRGPRGLVERQGPFETAPGSRAKLPDSLEAATRARALRQRPEPRCRAMAYTVCPPPTRHHGARHLAARDLLEIRALRRTLLDARSLVATASAERHGGPTVRHGYIQHTKAWCETDTRLVLGNAQGIQSTSMRTRPDRPDGAGRPAAAAAGRRQ